PRPPPSTLFPYTTLFRSRPSLKMIVSASPSVFPHSRTMPMKLSPSRTFMVDLPSLVSVRVIDHSLKVDHHRGLVADDPSIVPRGQQRHVARPAVELGAVVHQDAQHPRDVVLEVRRFAALRLSDRLDRRRPLPARLEDRAAYRRAADLDELEPAFRKLANLVRLAEILAFGLFHWAPPVRICSARRANRKCVDLRTARRLQ